MTANNIWQWFQENEASTGGVTDKIQNYLTAAGYTGATNEALYRWLGARGYEGSLADRIYQFEYFNTFRYIDISAKLVLEKFGTDAHVWIPGIGYFNGLQAGNYIDSAGTQAGLVDNPVGRANDAVGAITATQGTTANKPILRRGAVNLLTYSEQFDDASWIKSNTSPGILPVVTANYGTAPNGSSNADRIQLDGGSSGALGNSQVAKQSLALTSGITFTFSIWMRSLTSNVSVTLFLSDSTTTINVTTEWQRFSFTRTVVTTGTEVRFAKRDTWGTPGAADLLVWGAQLELGSTASEYIPTTTAAASSSSGNYYWQFDGSTDFLALSSVPFVATDDLCVVFAARTNEQAATGRAAFGFSGATGQRMAMIYNESGYWYFRFVDDTTTIFSIQATTQLAAGSLRVVSGRKSSNVRVLRLNAVQESSNSTPVGTTTITGGSIGSRDSASASAGYLGSIYPVIAIKGAVSDADLLVLERWVGSLSGVSI